MIEQFNNWCQSVSIEIEKVQKLLMNNLSDQPEALIRDIQIIEGWFGRMSYILAEANSYLDRAKFLLMPSKEKMTEFERKIVLDNSVSDIREMRDKIEGLHEAVKTRINLGQSLLAYMRQSLEADKHVLGKTGTPW